MGRPESAAQELIVATGQQDDFRIDVELIASHLGAEVVLDRLDREVSGLLYRDGEHIVIGVNASHVDRRQRFTVAHEIGHLALHPGRPLFMDHVRVNYRDAVSSTATDLEEIQANRFAAEILMPREKVVAEVRRLTASSTAASVVEALADTFDVSEQAMEFRLMNLGLRRQV
jgi:Zn-dependent peptidase ImmA (M78 family)